jgi:hypothetical protein
MRREFPTFRLVRKERSPLMWALYYGLLMFLWCPRFMTSYTTVIITRVYMPGGLIGTRAAYGTLRHERVHMRDCVRSGVVPFVVSYLFLLPAVLTLRAVWEMRGYAESMRVERERRGAVSDETVAHVARQLTGSSYLWMFPFPRAARRWAERVRDRVMSEEPGGTRAR